MPRFSLIVPVYNVASFLGATLASVKAQRHPAWECICIDDGSADESACLVDQYVKADRRFRAIHQRNGGVSQARNRGLDATTGAWILFLDGDDLLNPALLEHLTRAASCPPPYCNLEMVGFRSITFQEQSALEWPQSGEALDLYKTSEAIPPEVMWTQFWAWAYASTLAKSTRFRAGLTIGEDRLYAFQCLMQTTAVGFCNSCFGYGYRLRQGGATLSPITPKKYEDNLTFFRETFRLFTKKWRTRYHAFLLSFVGYILFRYKDTWAVVQADAREHFYWKGWRAYWRLSLRPEVPLFGRLGFWATLLSPTANSSRFISGQLWGRAAFLTKSKLKAALIRRLKRLKRA